MPEIVEVELYRRAAEATVGRRITGVEAPDAWYLKGGLTAEGAQGALRGRVVSDARRLGKLLLLDTDGPTLGLRFGMTGRLVVDGMVAVGELEYGPDRRDPAWDRLRLCFGNGGFLALNDPRRLGGVSLDPDESVLGPDAFEVGRAGLRRAIGTSRAPVKAALMDQSRLAGVGNLTADETLWQAGIDPARAAVTLTDGEWRRLHRALARVLRQMMAGGGSHTGRLQPNRVPGGTCPRDGAPLLRRTIGGRTTFSCPVHQR